MESCVYSLPVEHWWQVLVNLSLNDLCNVVLTSRHMNTVASLPELWAGMKINRRKMRKKGLAKFYKISRFKKVKEINFVNWKLNYEELERLLKEIPGSPLENVNLSCTNLRRVSADILANAVSHLHIVNLCGIDLATEQCVALLSASLSSTTLNNVRLGRVNLNKVPSELLANSISRLQAAYLWDTHLTTEQCVALLKASLSSATLTNLNLDWVNLSKVPSELLANSISRLQVVNLYKTGLTTEQCVALLSSSLSSTTLTNLHLGQVNLNKVPSELLANSISRLKDAYLWDTHLTTEQCLALLKAIHSSSTLQHIDLRLNRNIETLRSDQQNLLSYLPAHVRVDL